MASGGDVCFAMSGSINQLRKLKKQSLDRKKIIIKPGVLLV